MNKSNNKTIRQIWSNRFGSSIGGGGFRSELTRRAIRTFNGKAVISYFGQRLEDAFRRIEALMGSRASLGRPEDELRSICGRTPKGKIRQNRTARRPRFYIFRSGRCLGIILFGRAYLTSAYGLTAQVIVR